MKHKTISLSGALLDAAVAMAAGQRFQLVGDLCQVWDNPCGYPGACWTWVRYAPSSDWAVGGPIIERESILVGRRVDKKKAWAAGIDVVFGGKYPYDMLGPTPLVAAMRAYVASKLGEEVELP